MNLMVNKLKNIW